MVGKLSLLLVALLMLCPGRTQASWIGVGPFGGDARSLAADPAHRDRIFAGTSTGQIYVSHDGGQLWSRIGTLDAPTSWVVDNLLIDPQQPQVVYAAMWSLRDGGGGIFKSTDAGRTWDSLDGIRGQSVRALALAPSQPQVLVAGTLEGVFRSRDGGDTWQRISPAGHPEIHSVESVAMDPRNPEIIYAGTWHLPWKTTDGGAHWTSIKKGMIDDSDVFSIVIDPTRPNRVYATACTGIYRSDNAGGEWKKIQGIPTSSRRTHTLALDPNNPDILYAGTTEGLWRTPDAGQSWQRLTSHTWVINDILLDARNPDHFLLAMDRAGMMETWDGGRTFRGASRGFAQRQISRIVADPEDKERFYVSLLHDGEFGGVFTTNTRGASWQQLSAGLEGRDVLSLLAMESPAFRLLAGTSEGIFEYTKDQPVWKNLSRWSSSASPRGPAVRDLYQRGPGDPIYAATSAGVFASSDGRNWTRLPLTVSDGGVYSVASFGARNDQLLAATASRLAISSDGGQTWKEIWLDGNRPLRVHRVAPGRMRSSEVFAATELGLFRSTDGGFTWAQRGRGLPPAALYDVFLPASNPQHILVAGSSGVFYSSDGGEWYTRLGDSPSMDGLAAGVGSLQLVNGSEVVAASLYNGVFVQYSQLPLLSSEQPAEE